MPHILTDGLKKKLVPDVENTWYPDGLSTGPVLDGKMFINGFDNNGDKVRCKIGILNLDDKTIVNEPIIWGGDICFSSGIGDNTLFFHLDDEEIWGAELNIN